MSECRCSLRDARALPVGQAFALLAALKANRGWTVEGAPYALRDIAQNDEARMTNDEPEDRVAHAPPEPAAHGTSGGRDVGEPRVGSGASPEHPTEESAGAPIPTREARALPGEEGS